MNANKAENPPAFPHDELDANGQRRQWFGMTLRDYFAGQALQGMASSKYWAENMSEQNNLLEPVAKVAYMAADAMLAERLK